MAITNLKEETILKAATKVFAGKDFFLVTMEDVAKEAGVGKGTLYRYYKNKEDLYFNVINKGLEALFEYTNHEMGKENGSPQKIKKFIYCTLHFFNKNSSFVKVFLQEEVKFRQQSEYSKTRLILDKIERLLEEIIIVGQKNNELKKLDVGVCIATLVGIIKGFFISELDSLVKLGIPEAVEVLNKILLEGIAVKSN